MGVKEDIESILALGRGGRLAAAREATRVISAKKLSREQKLKLSYIANSIFYPLKAAQLLQSVVRPDRVRGHAEATDEEKTEYAKAIAILGDREGAAELLAQVRDADVIPRAYRFLAHNVFIPTWEHKRAIPYLEKVLSSARSSETDRVYAFHGIAVAHVEGCGDQDQARRAIASIIQQSGPERFAHMHWDAHFLLAQSHFHDGDLKHARRCLGDLESLEFGADDPTFSLMVRKWRCLIDSRSPSKRPSALAELVRVRSGLLENHKWEGARECDFVAAQANRDRDLFLQVYFGSPYPELRRRLLTSFKRTGTDLPKHYDHLIEPRAGAKVRGRIHFVDVIDGSNSIEAESLKRGQQSQRLLSALASDRYRPFSVAGLHRLLNPGEHFDPFASPDRIWQAIRHLRGWLKTARLPIEIREEQGLYRLTSKSGVALRMRATAELPPEAGHLSPKVRDLVSESRARFGSEPFKAGEIQKVLGLARATAVALLQEAIEAGLVEKLGNGPGTRYRIRVP